MKTITILDTTLRDGEQSPGASMNIDEKVHMARQLEKLGVDIIEAGFPAASEGDFEAVRAVAKVIERAGVAAFSRTNEADITRSWEAIREAKRPVMHVFIATSDLHMQYKLRMTRPQVLEQIRRGVTQARGYTQNVEFSAEDATRSDPAFLTEALQTALDAGAGVLNIPDTVGYTTPDEYGALIRHVRESVRGADNVVLSVHCHDDLGLAVANTLAAVRAGARQVECTINGIGERAGNAALEEIVMAMRTRPEAFPWETRIDAKQLYPTSRLLSQITGMAVQANKAIVGANAFAHEAGIHQDGVLKNRLTYEIMTPESVGIESNNLVLGKHSGRRALADRLQTLGYDASAGSVDRLFPLFKRLADKKKVIHDDDLHALIFDETREERAGYTVAECNAASGTGIEAGATVVLRKEGVNARAASGGNGPVDAALNAVTKITGFDGKVAHYAVAGIAGDTDAQAEVTVRAERGSKAAIGRGVDTDIVVASAKAYVNAINRLADLAP